MDRRNFVKASVAAIAATQLGALDAVARKKQKDKAPKEEVRLSGTDWSCEHAEALPGDLKVRFLGTGAAGWKSPTSGHRRNSSILIDGKILIDFTLSAQDMVPEGCHPEIIFYTHSHVDHFQPIEALKVGVKKVYLSHSIMTMAAKAFGKAAAETGLPFPELIPLRYGQSVIEEGIRFTAMPANHSTGDLQEEAQIYLIEKNFNDEGIAGVRIVYATDTAGIMGRAGRMAGIDSHVKTGIGVTGLIMEATMNNDEDFRIFNHSSTKTVGRTASMLLATDRLHLPEGQPVYLTHMAKSLQPSQEEMDATLPYPLRAAYDGLEVVFKSV